MVGHLAHTQNTWFESNVCTHLWFAKELFNVRQPRVGTALTAGFMSLNKLGDKDKAP